MKNKKLDTLFNIEPAEDEKIIEYNDLDNLPSTNIVHDEYDEKDCEIEDQFQDIYDKALDAFNTQMEGTDEIEGKYLARNTEVANQLLNTALSAAKEKAALKRKSDELKIKKENGAGNTNITNNNLIMDRNELLKMLNNKTEQ